MQKYNPENERIKRRYLTYLKEAKRQSEDSLDAVAKALSRFEDDTGCRGFKAFHINQAVAFKRRLAEQISQQTGEPLSKATLYSTLNALRNFFVWLAGQAGFRSVLTYSDADYFFLSEKDTRIATAHRDRPVPTIAQIEHTVRAMPCSSDVERRDRAVVAFAILTGARDRAIASLKIKHIDVAEGFVYQDAREVSTKFSKTISTWFFPVTDIFRQIVVEWVQFLLTEKLWGFDDPLFPATAVGQDSKRHFSVTGVRRANWASATPIREIFKTAFISAGLPYFNPHSFRKTLTRLGEQLCRTPEEFKAWSQNLGHDHVMTTFTSYGAVPLHRQGDIIRGIGQPQRTEVSSSHAEDIAEAVMRRMRASGRIG